MPRIDTAAEIAAREFSAFTLLLERFSRRVQGQAVNQMQDLQLDLIEKLERILKRGGPLPRSVARRRERLEALFLQTRESILRTTRKIEKTLEEELLEILLEVKAGKVVKGGQGLAVKSANQTINAALYGEKIAGAGISTVIIPESVARTLLKHGQIVEGNTIRDAFERYTSGFQNGFEREVRLGLFSGESVPEISKRVSDKYRHHFRPEGGKKRKIEAAASRNIRAIVRSSINSVSNQARLSVFEGVRDVVNGVQALVTLDERTSKVCVARSNLIWKYNKAGELIPVGHTVPFFAGPPWHFNCRTILTPTFVNGNELATELKKVLPDGRQTAIGGGVSEDWAYEHYLASRPAAERARIGKKVLGASVYRIWEEKRMPMHKLLDQNGVPLTARAVNFLFG